MIKIPFDATGTGSPCWMKSRFSGYMQIIMICPNGHPSTLNGHWINDDGTLRGTGGSDSVVCSFAKLGCGFHAIINLDDWQNHKPNSMQLPQGGIFCLLTE